MLKRQRQATPPPSALGDPPSFLPDGPIRPYPADQPQPSSKRQRIRPPPLDGTLRGWKPINEHCESDSEEDWTEDPHDAFSSLPPLLTTVDQYKDANSLLHELHVLHQHRLLFGNYSRNSWPNLNPKALLPDAYPLAGQSSPYDYNSTLSRPAHNGRTGRSCYGEPAEKGPVEEVQRVRQHYEDANRSLGSLFLSRRREVEEIASSAGPNPSG